MPANFHIISLRSANAMVVIYTLAIFQYVDSLLTGRAGYGTS